MTPEQLARLSQLLGMESLSETEEKELNFLQGIATRAELREAAINADSDASDSDEEEDDDDEGDDVDSDEDDEEGEDEDSDSDASDASAAKPTFMDNAKALGSSKSKLIARNRELATKLGKLKAENAQVTADLSAANTKLAKTQKDLTAVKAMLKDAKENARSVSEQVTDELAALGVDEKDLPSTGGDGKAEGPANEDELRAAVEKAETFEEKTALLEAWDKKHAA